MNEKLAGNVRKYEKWRREQIAKLIKSSAPPIIMRPFLRKVYPRLTPAILKSITDDELYYTLSDFVHVNTLHMQQHADRKRFLKNISNEMLYLYSCRTVLEEFLNGGLAQVAANVFEYYQEAMLGFRMIQADKCAGILETVFPYCKSTAEAHRYVINLDQETYLHWDENFNQAQAQEKVDELTAKHIKNHLDKYC